MYKIYHDQFRFVTCILYSSSANFCLILEVSAAGVVLFSSTVNMHALQKVCLSVCIMCLSESPNTLVVIIYLPSQLILKPENAVKSSENRKNIMADCQA